MSTTSSWVSGHNLCFRMLSCWFRTDKSNGLENNFPDMKWPYIDITWVCLIFRQVHVFVLLCSFDIKRWMSDRKINLIYLVSWWYKWWWIDFSQWIVYCLMVVDWWFFMASEWFLISWQRSSFGAFQQNSENHAPESCNGFGSFKRYVLHLLASYRLCVEIHLSQTKIQTH